jgi:hypothetical protein
MYVIIKGIRYVTIMYVIITYFTSLNDLYETDNGLLGPKIYLVVNRILLRNKYACLWR